MCARIQDIIYNLTTNWETFSGLHFDNFLTKTIHLFLLHGPDSFIQSNIDWAKVQEEEI
jgi:hypothetical protein